MANHKPRGGFFSYVALGLITLTVLGLVSGCSGGEHGDQTSAVKDTGAPAASGELVTASTKVGDPYPKKIIYHGDIEINCENLDQASKSLMEKIASVGGYVGDAQRSGARGSARTGTWKVRVPSGRFSQFMDSLAGIGELQSSKVESDDVSQEYYDAIGHIKSKQAEEARLVDILQHKTGRLADVLTVEKELARIREEIEQISGRVRFLANQADLSTVSVTLTEVKNFEPVGPPTLSNKVGRAFAASTGTLKDIGEGLLLCAVWLAPFATVFTLCGLGFLLARKSMIKRVPSAPTAPPVNPV